MGYVSHASKYYTLSILIYIVTIIKYYLREFLRAINKVTLLNICGRNMYMNYETRKNSLNIALYWQISKKKSNSHFFDFTAFEKD
jgi:hypothetical protein